MCQPPQTSTKLKITTTQWHKIYTNNNNNNNK